MSLRRRLFTLLLVSCVALAASLVGMTRLLGVGEGSREVDAAASSRAAMLALARQLDEGLPSDQAAPALNELSRTLVDGTIGVCLADGRITAEKTARDTSAPDHRGPRDGPSFGGPPFDAPPMGGPHGGGPPPFGQHPHRGDAGLLPFDRERVEDACRRATTDVRAARAAAPTDLLFITTKRTSSGAIAFSLVRIRRLADREPSPGIGLLALAGALTVALLALTAHGAWVLRKSTSSLRSSVAALEQDLRADVPEPAAEELADVARHLRSMASTLADAQERERTLLRDVEEQKRLAGLGRVVAGVAHEVRNPLAGMKLRLDSMALRSLDGRTRTDVEKCLGEIARLDRLVRTLLLASRKRVVARDSTDASALVAERIALAAPVAEAREIRVETSGNAAVNVERESFAGALDNLLRNAIDASPAGGCVEVQIARDAKCVRVEVLDEGPGVPDDRLGELFEPFFTTKASGTGLGLLLARATVEAHGGTLEYARRDGKTVFSMRIPDETDPGPSDV